MKNLKPKFFFTLSVLLFAAAWEITAKIISSPLVLPNLEDIFFRLLKLSSEKKFWLSVLVTFSRVLLSFFLTVILGTLLGFASGLSENIRAFLIFPFALIRSTPVVALIMVMLFWFPSESLPVICGILMALPVMSDAVSKAVQNTDKNILEMAQIFKLKLPVRIKGIYIPYVKTYFGGACRTVFSLSWKVIAAGEILSLPRYALGTLIQDNRILLEPASVFALVFVLTLLCVISEKFIFKFFHFLGVTLGRLRRPRVVPSAVPASASIPESDAAFGNASRAAPATDAILVTDLCFSYGEKNIFTNLSLEIEGGKITALSAPTGTGKSTLLKILSGLIPSNEYKGTITCPEISFIFQDDRLVPEISVLENIALPLFKTMSKKGAYKKAYEYLQKVGLEEKAFSKTENLSGGEKQKVQAARAFAFDAPVILMDEGTNSLDQVSKKELWETIKNLLSENDRTLIFVTHDAEEAKTYADKIISLPEAVRK
ncbi:MAG: ATP-binding cassette domain-containing protein [Treponema sp.]|nr:ATP-binding cassette domain-containing protein [Treponema sp.]